MAMAWEWYQREPDGRRREFVAAASVRRNGGRAFFLGAVDFGGNEQAVPVDDLGRIGLVDDVDGDGLALLHAQDRARRRAVVADGGEDPVGGKFDGDRGDAEGDVGGRRGRGEGLWALAAGRAWTIRAAASGGGGGEGQWAELSRSRRFMSSSPFSMRSAALRAVIPACRVSRGLRMGHARRRSTALESNGCNYWGGSSIGSSET